MNQLGDSRKRISSDGLITLSVVIVITVVSVILMLSYTSPELSWDEADYVANTASHWGVLWGSADYKRHNHGPMAIYLVKLGREVLPAGTGSLEGRLRFFIALVGSLSIGFLYWALRHLFRTSRAGALVGSSLLLFSVIRIEETNIIGPHHLMLACTLTIISLGYHWRDRPTLHAAVGLGAVMAFGALSMTYVIPAALCWAVAVSLAGAGWITWDRTHLKISWSIAVMLLTTSIIVMALWPPGMLQHKLINDFRDLVRLEPHATLVGDRFFEPTPRWTMLYWFGHLDAPILLLSVLIMLFALWRGSRNGRISSKHAYLLVCLAFFSAAALAAHIAGARYLLQVIGVLCLSTGAVFDEAIGPTPQVIRHGLVAVMVLAALNFIWLSQSSSYTPYLATDGYRAFVREEEKRLHEKSKAFVYGLPVLDFYAQQHGILIAWESIEAPWTALFTPSLPPDVKYILVPAFYNYMPLGQRIVAEHWEVVWSFKEHHIWELRLYAKP